MHGIEFCPRWSRKFRVFLAGETSDLVADAKAKRWSEFTESARSADLIVVAAAADIESGRDNIWLHMYAIVVAFGKPVLPETSGRDLIDRSYRK